MSKDIDIRMGHIMDYESDMHDSDMEDERSMSERTFGKGEYCSMINGNCPHKKGGECNSECDEEQEELENE